MIKWYVLGALFLTIYLDNLSGFSGKWAFRIAVTLSALLLFLILQEI